MIRKSVKNLLLIVVLSVLFCFIGLNSGQADNPKANSITFTKDIAPIFYRKCAVCHRPGEIAPMSLLTYKQARPWARSIREKVITRQMPPWHADPKYGVFENDRRLSEQEISTIVTWVDQGAREGDSEILPPAPNFIDGWNIGKPDEVLTLTNEFSVPAEGVVAYQYFTIPTNFKDDRWIQAAEVRSENRAVVHHVVVKIQEPDFIEPPQGPRGMGTYLMGFTPGEEPFVFLPGTAKLIKANSKLTFEVHYIPNGVASKDRPYIGLIFAKTPINKMVMSKVAVNSQFVIPPNAPNYEVRSSYTFTEDAYIMSLFPHMHLRGKDFLYRVVYPDGQAEIILSIPKYNPHWQALYKLAKPLSVPKGSRIECLAHYDNSTGNPYNPDATKELRWGDQLFDEMMVGHIHFIPVSGVSVLPAMMTQAPEKQTATPNQTEAEIQQMIRRFGEAWAQNDLATLESLLADDYLHTDYLGNIQNRAEWLEYVKERKAKGIVNKIEFADVKVRIYGDVAVVTGQNIIKGLSVGQNKESATKIRFTQVLLRKQGTWLRTAFQATPIAQQ